MKKTVRSHAIHCASYIQRVSKVFGTNFSHTIIVRGLRAPPKVILPFVGALCKRASLSELGFTG